MACYIACHIAGLATGALAVHKGGWLLPLLAPALYLTVASARHLQVGGVHHMTHGTFTGRQHVDDRIGWLLSLYLMIEEYGSYRQGHLRHHSAALSTDEDPAVIILRKAGIRNGMSVGELRRRLIFQMMSPIYHIRIFMGRLSSYFRSERIWKTALLVIWIGGLLALSVHRPILMFLCWWLPMTVLYQSVVLIRSVVEHWPEEDEYRSPREAYTEKTSAIFCGVALPETTGRPSDMIALGGWLARMAVELLCRFLFVCADGPNHDIHHLYPKSSWANDAALRPQIEGKLREKGLPGSPRPGDSGRPWSCDSRQ